MKSKDFEINFVHAVDINLDLKESVPTTRHDEWYHGGTQLLYIVKVTSKIIRIEHAYVI